MKVMSRVKLTCIVLTIILSPCFSSRVVVDSKVGRIVGTRRDSFTSFLGVPYGRVNESDVFGKSLPHPHFATEFEATEIPPLCPQLVDGEPVGSLDCLRLNIYIPNNSTKQLAVIVFIHGGGFVNGNANLNTYSPKLLVAKDVIVVTVHYRMGLYGFLCFEDEDFNNQGLEDQQLGLKWIKENIKEFGGDPNNMVLSGHSGGSIAVAYHLLFRNQYFNKAILQSGLILSPLSEPNGLLTDRILEGLGLNVTNKSVPERIDFLKQFGVNELLRRTSTEPFKICFNDYKCMEHHKLDKLKDMKVLIGITDKEAGFYFENPLLRSRYQHFGVTNVLQYGIEDVDDHMVDEVNAFYIKGNGKEDFIDFTSDFVFGYPLQKSVELYLKNKATVYRYYFVYDGGRNYLKLRDGLNYTGAVHADELGYQFEMDMFGQDISEEDAAMIDVQTTLWSSFANNGTMEYGGIKYPETNLENEPYIVLNGTRTHWMNSPFKKTMAFWDKFYEKYAKLSRSYPCFYDLLEYETKSVQSSGSFHSMSFTTMCFVILCLLFKNILDSSVD